MPIKSSDLHGNAPDNASVALVIIDMINDLEFPEGKQLQGKAIAVAKKIAQLKQNLKKLKIPVIFVNDNFGKWQSDFRDQINHCLYDNVCGKELAEIITVSEDDYYV